MQSKVLLGNGKVNLIHELSVLAFQTLKNLPAAPPSGGTAGTGGCKQFTPPLLHGYTPCSGGVLGYGAVGLVKLRTAASGHDWA